MIIKSLAMASAGLALVAAPVAATAAAPVTPASSLSVSKSARASTSTAKSNKVAGAGLVPLLIGAGIIAGATYLIVDHEDDDSDSN
jgi:hypothetical protein